MSIVFDESAFIKRFKKGEYKFGNDVYIVTHIDSCIGIKKGKAFYQMSWDDVNDMLYQNFTPDNKKRIIDLEDPLYYLFYKCDIASAVHKYVKENKIDENYWLELEKTPELLEEKENEYCDINTRSEKDALKKWESRLN